MEANKYKIGIIGSRDIILPFSMIGFDIFPAYQEQEAINTLRKLAQCKSKTDNDDHRTDNDWWQEFINPFC
ncbi:hypothetical protein V2N35_11450, partial [Streptococcus pneumoniae]